MNTLSKHKINRIMLTQPNFSWFGKRTWKLLPYNLGLLNARLRKVSYDSWILDQNFLGLSQEDVRRELQRTKPDAVGIGTFSTEYIQEIRSLTKIIKEELPRTVVILGGIFPTVMLEKAIEDINVDYFVIGEGEYRLVRLLDEINNENCNFSNIDGLAWSNPRVIQPMKEFIFGLDDIDPPDYTGLDLSSYMNYAHKYAHTLLPRRFPFGITITSRGCPYNCVFCAAKTVSGKKMRFRSPANVLEEIDRLYKDYGIKEIIFLDDNFLGNRSRAIEIMNGLIARNYGIMWKCVNNAIWSLDKEILQLMKDSGCYQITVSIESGNPDVLKKIIKKPVDLKKAPAILDFAKKLNFELIANFVFGFPGETWDQIRETVKYAESINVDLVNFHIATPLPKTELMDICLSNGYIKSADDLSGYTKAVIHTSEFSPMDLQVLRAFEWDRINFTDPFRKARIAKMEGISLEELEEWRLRTRRNLGTTVGWKE